MTLGVATMSKNPDGTLPAPKLTRLRPRLKANHFHFSLTHVSLSGSVLADSDPDVVALATVAPTHGGGGNAL